MINANMRNYDFYLYGDDDGYGQASLSEEVQGSIKMDINTLSQSVSTNINYKDSSYIGLTHNKNISDKYVIQFGEEKLKVNYINSKGRYVQVFMSAI